MEKESPARLRHEYKYSVSAAQEVLLRFKAASLLLPDPNVRPNGSYLISSLYFDDLNDSALNDSIRGADPRSKFRIRMYNGNTQLLRLEKKTKTRGLCRKESCELSREECEKLMRGELPPFGPYCTEKKKALMTELILRGLVPKVIVSFERYAFVYSGGNVRVTLDRELCSAADVGEFLSGKYTLRPVLPPGQCLLEVKWDELLPRHIREALSLESLSWTAFSKYRMGRRYHLQ